MNNTYNTLRENNKKWEQIEKIHGLFRNEVFNKTVLKILHFDKVRV